MWDEGPHLREELQTLKVQRELDQRQIKKLAKEIEVERDAFARAHQEAAALKRWYMRAYAAITDLFKLHHTTFHQDSLALVQDLLTYPPAEFPRPYLTGSVHELKIWPTPFAALLDGSKTHELLA